MKRSQRVSGEVSRPWILLVGLGLTLAGCHLNEGDSLIEAPRAVAIFAAPDSILLPAIASLFELTVTAILSDSSVIDATKSGKTTYGSTDAGIAAAAGGVVRAAGEGSARIVVERDGVADTVFVTVDEGAAVSLDTVRATPDTLLLLTGASATIAGSAVWANGARLEAAGLPFAYQTGDPAVVAVTVNGVASALAPGAAAVTLSFRGIAAQIPVTVTAPSPTISFAGDIRPTLQATCTFAGCHPGSGAAQRDLHLNTYAQLLAGGINGPVVTPGNGVESRIIRALRGTLPTTRLMPLGQPPLSEPSIQAIETWIDEGALDN